MHAAPEDLVLTGHGVRLREWSDGDLATMVELFDEPEVARRTPLRSPFDLDAAAHYLAGARERRAAGRGLHLAITTDGVEPRGEVLLFRADNGQEAELGYAVGARFRRQGLAAGAVALITDHAHDALGLPRVLLRIDPDNQASVAVARATGYHLTADPLIVRESPGRRVTLQTWLHHRPI